MPVGIFLHQPAIGSNLNSGHVRKLAVEKKEPRLKGARETTSLAFSEMVLRIPLTTSRGSWNLGRLKVSSVFLENFRRDIKVTGCEGKEECVGRKTHRFKGSGNNNVCINDQS